MAEAHRNLAPVLEANKTTGLGAMGLADLVRHRFADVTTGGEHARCRATWAVNRRVPWGMCRR